MEFIKPTFELDFILFVVFGLTFLILLYYYLMIFRRLAFFKSQLIPKGEEKAVTIVIAAKNEEDNLQRNLPLILSQDYPLFEVIVINDLSSDDTGAVLDEFSSRYNNLRAITIKQEGSHPVGKKYPLTLGIKGAKYDIVLLTDADCKPKSNQWLRKMAENYHNEKTEIVLGYGAYEKLPGILNRIIRFETFYIALQYLSFALGGNPYMGVGRNLSYKTSLFLRNKGFAGHTHISSGDDDLFINKVAKSNNTVIEVNPEAHTVSKSKRKFRDWVRQKRRHMTTAQFYKFRTKLMLGSFAISNFLFVASFAVLIAMNFQLKLILLVFFVKLVLQIAIFRNSMDKLGEKDLLFFAPFLELFLMFYYLYLYTTNAFIKQNKWK